MAKTWKEFEDLVGKETKRLYPQSAGWRVEPQKPLKGDKYRVDYVVYKGSEHYVIEAKQVEELEKSQVDQVIECKRVFNASKGLFGKRVNSRIYVFILSKLKHLVTLKFFAFSYTTNIGRVLPRASLIR